MRAPYVAISFCPRNIWVDGFDNTHDHETPIAIHVDQLDSEDETLFAGTYNLTVAQAEDVIVGLRSAIDTGVGSVPPSLSPEIR